MTARTEDVRGEVWQLAAAVLAGADRIAARSAERMREQLPSYAAVPQAQLMPTLSANVRRVLEAVQGGEPVTPAGFRALGDARARQGISSHDMVQGWWIGLQAVREEASAVAEEQGFGAAVLLAFVEALLRWGDVGMRATAAAHNEREAREFSRLATEQAALRRVATQVAQRVAPDELFAAVAQEVCVLLGGDRANMIRYEAGDKVSAVATSATGDDAVGFEGHWPLGGGDLATSIARHRGPARVDDWSTVPGDIAAFVRERMRLVASVGAPIVVDGRLWGALLVHRKRGGPFPADTEERLADFTDLVAIAIANVQAHTDLEASRSRLAGAADEERRRVVRDLHDGAQQRLVHTVLSLKLARRALEQGRPVVAELVTEALTQAETATVELRELAHGIMPAALTNSGLRAAVDALASRSSVPVVGDVQVGRFPPGIEATAYFVVAEALTNVTKHARATRAEVRARHDSGVLRVRVRDDGVGGAQAGGGGLVGLADRLAAVGGHLRVDSPEGRGTVIEASIPVTG